MIEHTVAARNSDGEESEVLTPIDLTLFTVPLPKSASARSRFLREANVALTAVESVISCYNPVILDDGTCKLTTAPQRPTHGVGNIARLVMRRILSLAKKHDVVSEDLQAMRTFLEQESKTISESVSPKDVRRRLDGTIGVHRGRLARLLNDYRATEKVYADLAIYNAKNTIADERLEARTAEITAKFIASLSSCINDFPDEPEETVPAEQFIPLVFGDDIPMVFRGKQVTFRYDAGNAVVSWKPAVIQEDDESRFGLENLNAILSITLAPGTGITNIGPFKGYSVTFQQSPDATGVMIHRTSATPLRHGPDDGTVG